MNFDDLSPELQERVRAAKTPEEIMTLAKEQGYTLSEEELEAISGGISWDPCACDGYTPCKPRKSTPSITGRE